jgi:multimeric flavodoxin WrbA
MSKSVILFSSSRRNGNTGKLTDDLARLSNTEVIDLKDYNISEYDYEHKNINDDFIALFKQLMNYQNIVFASPVYWDAVAPGMKIFLDRISDLLDIDDLLPLGRQLREKQGFVLTTSIQEEVSAPFLGAFQSAFDYLGMEYNGCLHIDCKDDYQSNINSQALINFGKRLDE